MGVGSMQDCGNSRALAMELLHYAIDFTMHHKIIESAKHVHNSRIRSISKITLTSLIYKPG